MSHKRTCSDSVKEALAKKIKNKWLEKEKEKPLDGGASLIEHFSALNPTASPFTPSPNSSESPLTNFVSLDIPEMATTRHQAALQKAAALAAKSQIAQVMEFGDSLLDEIVHVDLHGGIPSSSTSVSANALSNKLEVQDDILDFTSEDTKVPSSNCKESVFNDEMDVSKESTPSKDLSMPPPPPSIPPAPPVPPILKSALMQPKSPSSVPKDTSEELREIKKLLSTEIKSSIDNLTKSIDDPTTGVMAQVKAINFFLFDKEKGLHAAVQDHTQKLFSQKTSVSNICTRMDSLESAFAPLKSLNNKSQNFESRITTLEKTVQDPDEGVDAIALKLNSMQNDISHPESGLITKVENLQSDLQEINQAIASGEHEIVLKTHPPEIQSKLDAIANTIRADTDAAMFTLKTETNVKFTELQTAIDKKNTTLEAAAPADLATQLQQLKQDVQNNIVANRMLRKQVQTLTNVSQVHHKKMQRMKDNILQNAAKHMRDELIIGGIRQEPEENAFGVVKTFFHEKMRIWPHEDDILEAERGKASPARLINGRRVQIPPVMFVRVSLPFSRFVLKNTWKLKNAKDEIDGYGFYIHVNIPEAQRAVRDKWAPAVSKIKADNAKLPRDQQKSVKFTGTNFFIDKKLIQEKFSPPSPQDLVTVSIATEQMINSIQFLSSAEHSESGSTFSAFGAVIHSLDLITPAYIKIRRDIVSAADNIFMAYRILRLDGRIQQGSADDGECYGDLEIRDILKEQKVVNVIVFVSRHYQGVHIGKARFRLIRDAVEEMLPRLNCDRQPEPQRRPRRTAEDSHDDLD